MQGPKQGFWKLTAFLIGILLFLGGLGVELFYVKVYGVLISTLLIGLAWFWKEKIVLPKTFKLYGLFLAIFLISLLWSRDWKFSFEHFLLFLSGGLFWLAFYNLSSKLGKGLDKIVLALGIVFGGLYFYNTLLGDSGKVNYLSLYLPYTSDFKHNNIGDLWSVVLTIIVFYILQKPKRIIYWVLSLFGILFLYVGQSRSSYVALAAGVFYLFKGHNLASKNKKILVGFIILSAVLFIFTGMFKTTLFTRPYYVQALLGLIHNPFGVGVGNFGVISFDPENHIFDLTGFSSVAHNIVLEITAGMGLLGIIFVVWLVKEIINLWKVQDLKSFVYGAIFFALTANFFFHSTYFVPTMLWLWFAFLGTSQAVAGFNNKPPLK